MSIFFEVGYSTVQLKTNMCSSDSLDARGNIIFTIRHVRLTTYYEKNLTFISENFMDVVTPDFSHIWLRKTGRSCILAVAALSGVLLWLRKSGLFSTLRRVFCRHPREPNETTGSDIRSTFADVSLGETKEAHYPPLATPIRGFTPEELRRYDGSDPCFSSSIYISVMRRVFAVGPDLYGPNAPYHCFAGRECSRHLGLSTIGDTECDKDYSTLNFSQKETLLKWYQKFHTKYETVGWYVPLAEYFQ